MAKLEVNQGILCGFERETENGFKYISFLKIPYAEPPVGDLRFKSPRPPKSWQGERCITKVDENSICHQRNLNLQHVGSEDCLYLNVYTPMPIDKICLLPVMVSIHGGGFILGNGIVEHDKKPNIPDPLIEHNVVIVTINYRLGVFGFLSLDIPEASGNMGLKDQVFALQWVQDNIATFGGDRNNVTVFGVSAGGASIEYHMLSPLCENLFSKAIIQSGSAINHWAVQKTIKGLSIQLAEKLGYQGATNDIQGIHEFLMRQSTKDLLAAALTLTSNYKALDFGFVPSIEKDFGNGKAFLTQSPYVLLKQGKFIKVPVLRGFCENEAACSQLSCPGFMKELKEEKKFADILKYNLHTSDIAKFNDLLTKQYFEGKSDEDREDIQAAVEDFFAHYDFVAGIITSSKIIANHDVPIYLYKFAFMGSISALECYCKLERKCAVHADDAGYTLGHTFDVPTKITEEDVLIRKRMSKMWTDFAKTGNPTPEVSDLVPLLWPKFNSEEQTYMVIDQEMHLKNKYELKKMAIFQELYHKYK